MKTIGDMFGSLNLGEMFASKKAKAFLAELVVLVCVQLFDMDPELAEGISKYTLGLTVAYMGSQGIADHGREKPWETAAKTQGKVMEREAESRGKALEISAKRGQIK